MNGQEKLYDSTAEDTILGAVLAYSDKCLDAVRVSGLTEGDFYKQPNKAIFRVILKIAADEIHIDTKTVMMEIQKQGLDQEVTPMVLTALQNLAAPSDAYESQIKAYVKTIKDYAARREMQDLARCLLSDSQDMDKDVSAISSDIQERLTALGSRESGDEWQDMKQGMIDYLGEIMERQGGTRKALQTGFIDVDKTLGGFEAGQLIILAARPAMGKTSLALNIATNVCKQGKAVLFVSQEMTATQLKDRMTAALTGINAFRLKTQVLSEHELNKVIQACEVAKNYRLNIFENRHTVAEIKARAQLARAKFGGLDLVVVDHIQLVKSDARGRYNSRVHEVGEISHGLKELATRLKVPVLALSQLSRAAEGRDDKRPLLSDLRESGDLEQDADVVFGLYRSGYYSHDKTDNDAELGVLKAKDAEGRNIPLRWFPQFQLFRSATGRRI